MIHLIVVILGIALMSYMLLSGISYTNPDAFDAREKAGQWSIQNMALSAAWNKYHILYGKNPVSIVELSSQLTLPLALSEGFVLTSLTQGFQGWCYEGQANKSSLMAMSYLAKRYPTQYGLSAECGAIGGEDPTLRDGLSDTYPVPVALTYKFSN
jgi:hypothetical protein